MKRFFITAFYSNSIIGICEIEEDDGLPQIDCPHCKQARLSNDDIKSMPTGKGMGKIDFPDPSEAGHSPRVDLKNLIKKGEPSKNDKILIAIIIFVVACFIGGAILNAFNQ
ncbi:MAG: hypothetical protein GY870_05405 [archaeon]|nr:hypothetical protein [archaeon]